MRRIPVQLFEAAMARAVAAVILLGVVPLDPAVNGLLFLAGLSAHTFGRRLLFPLRGVPARRHMGG